MGKCSCSVHTLASATCPDVRRPAVTRARSCPPKPPGSGPSAALRAARDPLAARPGPAACRPEDVVKALDGLYRHRRIELLHARILRIWGLRGVAPNPGRPRERCDWRLWREALERLEGPLRAKGIVAGVDPIAGRGGLRPPLIVIVVTIW